MARIVQKFGGTSVAGIDRIRSVALRVKREVDSGSQVAVVVSAMAGTTNQLVGWSAEASVPKPPPGAPPSAAPLPGAGLGLEDGREYDVVVAAGEQVTAGL